MKLCDFTLLRLLSLSISITEMLNTLFITPSIANLAEHLQYTVLGGHNNMSDNEKVKNLCSP